MKIVKMKKNRLPVEKLLQKPLIRIQDFRDNDHHPSLLSYYANKGLLERVGRGLYQNKGYLQTLLYLPFSTL